MTSVAWMMPSSPGKMPSTPPSAQEGTSPGGGGSGIQAAIARAIFCREDAGLSLKTKDRGIHIRLARKHARIVDQIARWKIVRPVRDDVEILKDFQRIFAGQLGLKLHHLRMWD